MSQLASIPATQTFGTLLKHWRLARRMSQLALALEAEISARHLSFLETGRALPSRDIVLLLATMLDVPLRERNALLIAAGYAPVYQERSLAAPELAQVQRALDFILQRQEPYPGLVLDQHWNVVLQNQGAARVFQYFLAPDASGISGRPNAMRLTFHPQGLRPWITNWDAMASQLIQRLHHEVARALPGDDAAALLVELLSYPGVPQHWRTPNLAVVTAPLLPLELCKGGIRMSFFTTIATLGTPQDITLEELRIESFFPVDQETEDAVQRLARGDGIAPEITNPSAKGECYADRI